jgi:ATP-dependent DNA ligase
MVMLYKLGANNEIRVWSINIDFYYEVLIITYGVQGGAMQRKEVKVQENHSGRSINSQLRLEYQSRIKKQKDLGYKESVEEAQKGRTNALGFERPMLAKPMKDCRSMDLSTAYVQPKLDGHRCLITKKDGKIQAYSRQGIPITTISHILDGMHLEEGTILDGELYTHGARLQQITSWVKREQEATKQLHFWAYDIISELGFEDRFAELTQMYRNLGSSTVLTPTSKMSEIHDLNEHFNYVRSHGYEGLILRPTGFSYQVGKRHKSLIKMKAFHDKEFKVVAVGFTPDGW